MSTAQWEWIRVLLPRKVSNPRRTESDNRLSANGSLLALRSGAHWCDPPERYRNWKTLHRRFSRGCHADV
ncbi:transposase [Gluconobacter sp. GP1]|uniref:transposase n=1 Tax=Gluconobacter sp. GP1 TaxID=3046423 RepID=UPI0038CF64E1